MCIDYDGDGPEFFNCKTVKAKKEHKCCECNRVIQPGEAYKYIVGKWEGDVSIFKTCGHCDAAGEWLDHHCGGYPFEGLLEDLQEHLRDYSDDPKMAPMFLARAIVGLRRDWKRFDEKGLMKPLLFKKPVEVVV